MTDKEQKYEELVAQAKALSEAENDGIALMANVAAIIHGTFHFWWTGFYRVVGEELVLRTLPQLPSPRRNLRNHFPSEHISC